MHKPPTVTPIFSVMPHKHCMNTETAHHDPRKQRRAYRKGLQKKEGEDREKQKQNEGQRAKRDKGKQTSCDELGDDQSSAEAHRDGKRRRD